MGSLRSIGGHLGRRVMATAIALRRALPNGPGAGGGRVFVFSPSYFASGGPEALHQLVDELNRQGVEAHICYTPFPLARVPAAYAHYHASPAFPADNPGDLVVIPEADTALIRWFRRAKVAVWWLSVDFFYGPYRGDEWFREQQAADARGELHLPRQATWDELRQVMHLSQSNYATEFLRQRGIHDPIPLGDYIHPSFTEGERTPDPQARGDVILYNPAKSRVVVERLKARFPEFQWRELRGLARADLQTVLETSKLYVDFGNHPGRDRIPREAAASGTCMILGRKGTVAVEGDVPIPDRYKLDPGAPDFESQFADLARAILAAYATHAADFAPFRTEVRQQHAAFRRDVQRIAQMVAAGN